MKSVQSNKRFEEVPKAEIARSSFNRSHGHKTTLDAGYLVPIYCDEALPGDTFNLKLNAFARLATPLKPLMDNMKMSTFFFAVPYRLLWDNWAKFMGEQIDPGDSTDYLMPTMVSTADTGYETESIHDYLGIPTGVPNLEHSCLWHRAYNLIYQEWFRDQNLQDSPVINRGDGPDSPDDYQLLRRGKRHDYFTSCLPWPQKGGEPVRLPLGDSAPIATQGNTGDILLVESIPATVTMNLDPTDPSALIGGSLTSVGESLFADLSEATGSTVSELRTAFQIQKMLERDARGGTRLVEIYKSHFGVTSPDARMQRPEYLGGGSSPIGIHPVPQTSDQLSGGPGAETPQANLAAYGTVEVRGTGFTKSFTEHCVIIGLVSVNADLTYQQSLPRMFSRATRYDHYFPALAHLAEQAVLNKEIYAQGTAEDDNVFGYQERYAEFRYKPSTISGKFRSADPESLDIWHLSQDFETLPTLSAQFIEDNPPIDRVVAVPSEPDFLYDSYIELTCARPMPTYGTPGMIDHF